MVATEQVPDLPYKLSGLYQVVDHRLAVFKRLLALAGRLDLIMAQIAQRQELEPAREAPTTIYYGTRGGIPSLLEVRAPVLI